MSNPQTGVDRCSPMLGLPYRKPDEIVVATTTHYNAMVASSEWATASTTLDKPASAWLKTANDIDSGSQKLEDLLKKVEAQRSALATLVQLWSAQTATCLGTVKEYCAGSKTKCKNLGFAYAGRVVRPAAPVPSNLLGKRNKKAGIAEAMWKCDGRRHQYQVQHATNPADSATYSGHITVSKRTFQLPGQTSGATVYVRVQVLDPKLPDGHSDWTPWAAITVS